MLKLNKTDLNHLESQHPGIVKTIQEFDEALLPGCPNCQSDDTAKVNCGIVDAIHSAEIKLPIRSFGARP